MTFRLREHLKSGMRVASMGYPDLIAPMPAIELMLGDRAKDVKFREDSEAICQRHFLTERRPIPDAASFFELLGCKLDVFDIVQERGCEILCDLNTTLFVTDWRKNRGLSYSYDLVLDVGTLEHCFNIGQAAFNMASLVRDGGYILHENPFNWGNHGFYGLNPTWYADFYEANGFELLACSFVTRDGRGCAAPQKDRFVFVKEEVNILTVAKRIAVVPQTYPVQSKYANLIPAAGVPGELKKEVANG